jgi:hypothetical protein
MENAYHVFGSNRSRSFTCGSICPGFYLLLLLEQPVLLQSHPLGRGVSTMSIGVGSDRVEYLLPFPRHIRPQIPWM